MGGGGEVAGWNSVSCDMAREAAEEISREGLKQTKRLYRWISLARGAG